MQMTRLSAMAAVSLAMFASACAQNECEGAPRLGVFEVHAALFEIMEDVFEDAAVAVDVVARIGGPAGEALGREVAGAAAFARRADRSRDAEVAEDDVLIAAKEHVGGLD